MNSEIIIRESLLRGLYTKLKSGALRMIPLKGKSGALQTRSDLTQHLANRLQRWMESLAGLEAKERDIISEITAIEEKHLAMRRVNKVRYAAPKAEPEPDETFNEKSTPTWLWLLFLWLMMRSPKKSPLRVLTSIYR